MSTAQNMSNYEELINFLQNINNNSIKQYHHDPFAQKLNEILNQLQDFENVILFQFCTKPLVQIECNSSIVVHRLKNFRIKSKSTDY